ncbi:unnamed protein product [Moneuplotes crassus]|uniref:Uncharacterized protein n=1 Tax=Euplotes crassus TaxID=5936 RepID=A0AAD1Y9F7_EUPCR|nr:unnamed protein product [Moneuplotes crassus]
MAGLVTKAFKWSAKQIKKQNLFDESISLTHKTKNNFMAFMAGLVSIAMMVFLVGIGIILAIRMIKKSEMQWNQNTTRVSLRSDTTLVNVTEADMISVRVIFTSLMPEHDAYDLNRIFNISFVNIEQTYAENFEAEINEASLSYARCTKYDFPESRLHPSLEKYTATGQIKQMCFNLTGTSIAGNSNSRDLYKYVRLHLRLKSEFIKIMKENIFSLQFEIQSRYVDLNDLDNPIKSIYWDYTLGTTDDLGNWGAHRYKFDILRNEVELQDTWWDFLSNPTTKEFKSVDTDSYNYERVGEHLATFYTIDFSLGEKTNQYGRRVLNFLEVTGVVGGLFEILDIFVGIIIGYLYTYSLKREITKDLVKADNKIQDLQKSIDEILKKDQVGQEQNNVEVLQRINRDECKESSKKIEDCKEEINSLVKFRDENSKITRTKHFLKNTRHLQGLSKVKPISHESPLPCELQSLKNHNTSHTPPVPPKHPSAATSPPTKLNPDKFLKEHLDCVSLVFAIKTLQLKVQYLLARDTCLLSLPSQPPSQPPPQPPSQLHPQPLSPPSSQPPTQPMKGPSIYQQIQQITKRDFCSNKSIKSLRKDFYKV